MVFAIKSVKLNIKYSFMFMFNDIFLENDDSTKNFVKVGGVKVYYAQYVLYQIYLRRGCRTMELL